MSKETMSATASNRKHCCHLLPAAAFSLLFFSIGVRAQEPSSASAPASPPATSASQSQGSTSTPAANSNSASSEGAAKSGADAKTELIMHDTGTTFKLRVNLVQVRVVVRDEHDNPVANLRREDFQLLDQGKPQVITNFSVETPQSRIERAQAAAKTQAGDGSDRAAIAGLPERFVAMVFDDEHMKIEDALPVRQSATRFLQSLAGSDRVGIFSTSGQVNQDFTSDREALQKTLLGVIPRSVSQKAVESCPQMTYYMADQIENKLNAQVLAVAAQEVLECQFRNDPSKAGIAQSIAENMAMQALSAGDAENEYAYRHLEDALRALSGRPGERIMVLVSPGFLLTKQTLDEMGVIDRANRANIVINTIDARGLYVPDTGDISQPVTDTIRTAGFKASFRLSAQFEQQFVLMDFAQGTGGTFFHNSNDLDKGMRLAGAAPEISYMLGFSPQNEKMDGRYHTIKVTLAGKQKYSLQARRGYYAPKKIDDPAEQAKQEIQEAVFSQEEIRDLPLDLQTQYFKTGNEGVHLSVVSHLEVKGIRFRKADGRNVDELTVATVIFDENGNYVTGGEKILQMHLLDTTYEKLSRTGLNVKSSFDLKPGKYLVRQVVRDSEGAQMAARNGAVSIPF
jgi:VWFA-related protein